tara:strand:+ start:686 stop:862 length:177 start_codon:yes stop_codon:yes gene_type:complete
MNPQGYDIPVDSYMCRDCGERIDEVQWVAVIVENTEFDNIHKYNCPYCGVYDGETGEV